MILLQEFGASNAKASIIISLLTGLTLGAGPLASAITNKFGCRVTTILGSLIASCGYYFKHSFFKNKFILELIIKHPKFTTEY